MKIINYRQHQESQLTDASFNKKIDRLQELSDRISKNLRSFLFFGNNPNVILENLLYYEDDIASYKKVLDDLEAKGFDLNHVINQYVSCYMSLPYLVPEIDYSYFDHDWFENVLDDNKIRAKIKDTLDVVVNRDVDALFSFRRETGANFRAALSSLANGASNNLSNLSNSLQINKKTLQKILETLELAQIITAIPSIGASSGKISKSYKYCFNSPAIRQALCSVIIKENNLDDKRVRMLRGNLLEDTVFMHLKRILKNEPLGVNIEYDAAAGGADFVVMPIDGTKSQAIVIEVGYNKSDCRQVEQTLKKVGKYGLVITDCINRPKTNPEKTVLYIPLKTFLLI